VDSGQFDGQYLPIHEVKRNKEKKKNIKLYEQNHQGFLASIAQITYDGIAATLYF